jgi:hypothetical protein
MYDELERISNVKYFKVIFCPHSVELIWENTTDMQISRSPIRLAIAWIIPID